MIDGIAEKIAYAAKVKGERDIKIPTEKEAEIIICLYYKSMFLCGKAEVRKALCCLEKVLANQISRCLLLSDGSGLQTMGADELTRSVLLKLPDIKAVLLKDVQFAFDSDPAATSKQEIISCYPGFFAVAVYRLAHQIYGLGLPILARIISEYAHSKTGIDIHPGATIGEEFFIDHGTGTVIGQTAEIGKRVKLYQGVTLGALSTSSPDALRGVKRHPSVCDGVTVYSGATILGGSTQIGEGARIGCNALVVKSVPPFARVN